MFLTLIDHAPRATEKKQKQKQKLAANNSSSSFCSRVQLIDRQAVKRGGGGGDEGDGGDGGLGNGNGSSS